MSKISTTLLLFVALSVASAPTAIRATPAVADTASPPPASPKKRKTPRNSPATSTSTGTRKSGKLWLEIDKWNTEFLYQTSLPAGVGSNDIGLDRGQMGETKIVRFERIGAENFADAVESRVSRGHQRSGRARGGARFVRGVGAVGFYVGRGRWERRQRACVGRRDRVFLARHAPRPRNSRAHQARRVQARR